MKKTWLRMLLAGTALLVLLLGALAWLLVRGIDGDAVLARAAREVHAATGRELSIDGPLRLKLLPRFALEAAGVRLGNLPGGSQPDMARIGTLRMDVALAPLLQRRVEIGRIELSDVELLLETDAQGAGNWSFAPAHAPGDDPATGAAAAPPPSRQPGAIRMNLANLWVRDGRLTLRTHRPGQADREQQVQVDTLSLAQEGDSQRWQLGLKGQWHGQKFDASGTVGVERDAGTQTRRLPLDLDVLLEGASVALKGALGLGAQAGQAKVTVDATVQRKQALESMLGISLPLPLPASAHAEIDWQRHQLMADDFELESQGQSLAGSISWSRAATPASLKLDLHADGLDLARLYPRVRAGASAAEAVEDSRVVPDIELPALRLPALAIEATLRAERLVLPNGLELASVKASGTSMADRIDVEHLQFDLARGTIHTMGQWRQSAGSKAVAPRVSAQVQARGLAMDALLAVLRREAPISGGRTDVDATLSGSGHSLRALAASLNGEVRLRMGPATSIGTARANGPGDLVAALLHALTPLRDPSSRLQVRCAAARLPVQRGQIVVDRSIAVESERVDLVVSGAIDLGSERLDLAMRPTVRKGTGLDPGAFAGLVKIGGTFAAPQVQANIAGTAREALSIGAAVATSGVTLLGERLLGRVNDPHPCESAYSGAGDTAASGARNAQARPNEADAGSGPLRQLFGR